MCLKCVLISKKHVVGQLNQARNLEQLHRSINNICNGGLHGDGECTAFDCSVKSKIFSAKYAQTIVFNGLKKCGKQTEEDYVLNYDSPCLKKCQNSIGVFNTHPFLA